MLTLLLLTFPLLAALILFLAKSKTSKTIALALSVVEFVIALAAFGLYKNNPDACQLWFNVAWVQSLGIHFNVAINGMSLLMILLTTFLVPLIILSSFKKISNKNIFHGAYHSKTHLQYFGPASLFLNVLSIPL